MLWLGLLGALLVLVAVLWIARAVAYRRRLASLGSHLRRYAEENRALARAPGETPAAGHIILFGDDIAEAWNIGQDFPELAFLNRGIAGESTLHLLARFQQDVLNLEPRVVILFGGKNDPAAQLPLSASQDHFQLMTRLGMRCGVALVLTSLLPVGQGKPARRERGHGFTPSYILAMNSWLRAFAQERGLEYADFYTALADANSWMRPAFSDDGVHPNSAGYRAMAAVLCPVLERVLERASRPSGRAAKG